MFVQLRGYIHHLLVFFTIVPSCLDPLSSLALGKELWPEYILCPNLEALA